MDSWPHRTSATNHVPKRRKAKSQVSSEISGYPVVEHGAITAANVHRKANSLEWTFLSNEDSERRLHVIRDPVKIFPATKRIPARTNTNVPQTAEQATQFLRLHYPDADFPHDIVRNHIAEDLDAHHKQKAFDPYAGNSLATFVVRANTRQSESYVAFPMGETGCQLNVSPVLTSEETGMLFKPTTKPTWESPIPILQLISGTFGLLAKTEIHTVLAARTYSSTSFLGMSADPEESGSPIVSELSFVSNSQTGGRPSVDVILSDAAPSRAILVTITAHCMTSCSKLVAFPHIIPCFPSNDVLSFDLRMPNSSQTIHRCPSTHAFTDLAYSSSTGFITVCSTSEILWLDERYDKRPIFSVKHGRRYDQHLQISNVMFKDSPLTFLTSRRDGLIAVYDVSQGEDNLLHLHTPPYTLPSVSNLGSVRSGYTWLQNPDEEHRTCFMQLTDRGSLHRMDLEFSTSTVEDIARGTDGGYEWSDMVWQIEKDVENQHEDTGPTGERGYEETDLNDAYCVLFCEDEASDDTPTAAYDLLETMPFFWQKQEEPIEHVLTTFDIAFRSGTDPRDPSRADFFTGTPLDSVRGHRALKQGRIPLDVVKKRSALHWDMGSVHKRFVPDTQGGSTDVHNTLLQYDLIVDDNRPAASYRRETEAKDQLALDLSLSSNVFSSRAIKSTTTDSVEDDIDTMSTAAGSMSLDANEPPQVKFGFLDPIPVEDAEKNYDKVESSSGKNRVLSQPLGVRLLLSEWTIGEDPQAYHYVDPYDVNAPPPRSLARTKEQPRKRTPPPVASQPSRIQKPPAIAVKATPTAPPAIVSTQPSRPAPVPSVPSLLQRQQSLPRVHQTGSQPTQTGWSSGSQSQSQMPVMSTQVLPGPHGGRPQPAKKKPPKKRVGGF
ncbi:hypothetical protein QCA50_003359 [Cerrena zonata]|uniref:RRN6 K-rich C-terminal domain-containing protein n=1 Tax=Cerrena zonata TaxID=2478898 RepID=A0AAW0GMC2_9APHY